MLRPAARITHQPGPSFRHPCTSRAAPSIGVSSLPGGRALSAGQCRPRRAKKGTSTEKAAKNPGAARATSGHTRCATLPTLQLCCHHGRAPHPRLALAPRPPPRCGIAKRRVARLGTWYNVARRPVRENGGSGRVRVLASRPAHRPRPARAARRGGGRRWRCTARRAPLCCRPRSLTGAGRAWAFFSGHAHARFCSTFRPRRARPNAARAPTPRKPQRTARVSRLRTARWWPRTRPGCSSGSRPPFS